MTQLKKRLSLLLCMLLVFTSAFIAVPEETQAATTYQFNHIGAYGNDIYVYKGADNLYAGDYIFAGRTTNGIYKEYGYLSRLDGVSYKSSETSVASISSKTGKITTKKNGTTTITATYKKQKVSFKMNFFFNVSGCLVNK